jgi:hypothetical protein
MDKKYIEVITTEQQYAIEPETKFEEDLLIYCPKVEEMIKLGKDATESPRRLAAELGIGEQRFVTIYNAVKKEILIRSNLRLGPDQRGQLVSDCDTDIGRIRQERNAFKKEYERVLKKAEDDGIGELTPSESKVWAMKPTEVQRVLIEYDKLIRAYDERRAKLLGIEQQRTVSLSSEVNDLLSRMVNMEKQKNYNALEAKNPIEAEFNEIEEEIND